MEKENQKLKIVNYKNIEKICGAGENTPEKDNVNIKKESVKK